MIRSACAARCQQRGVGLWACTCRQACCHPTRGITVIIGRGVPVAKTYRQSFRGAMVVQHICAQVMLTGEVGG